MQPAVSSIDPPPSCDAVGGWFEGGGVNSLPGISWQLRKRDIRVANRKCCCYLRDLQGVTVTTWRTACSRVARRTMPATLATPRHAVSSALTAVSWRWRQTARAAQLITNSWCASWVGRRRRSCLFLSLSLSRGRETVVSVVEVYQQVRCFPCSRLSILSLNQQRNRNEMKM